MRPPFRAFTTAEGMPHDRVMRVRSDQHGFIWFATVDGLARFDGRRFMRFGPEHGLDDAVTWDLLAGPNSYWVATDRVGLYRLDATRAPVRFEAQPIDGEPTTVYSLHRDRRGGIWAATGRGLYRGDERADRIDWKFVASSDRAASKRRVITLAEDPSGTLWVGGGAGLQCVGSDGSLRNQSQALRGIVSTVLTIAVHNDRLLVGGESGWAAVKRPDRCESQAQSIEDPAVTLQRRHTLGNPVRSILPTSNGELWIAEVGVLVRISAGGAITVINEPDVPDVTVRSLLEDQDGNIWAATDNAGALRFSPVGFSTMLGRHGLAHNFTTRLVPDRDGRLIAAMSIEAFSRLSGDRAEAAGSPVPAPVVVRSLRHYPWLDRRGVWWMPSVEGLWRFPAPASFRQLSRVRPSHRDDTSSGLPGEACDIVWEDAGGNIWISAYSEGKTWLARWTRATSRFESIDVERGLPHDRTAGAFADGSDGQVWILLTDGRLARWNGDRLEQFSQGPLQRTGWQVLHRGASGTIWFGDGARGLFRLIDHGEANPTAQSIEVPQALIGAVLHCVIEARDGMMFAGTTRGIFRFDPSRPRSRHFTTHDGLGANEVLTCGEDSLGRLWFGTTQGVSRYEQFREQRVQSAEVYVAGVRVAGRAVPLSATATRAVGPLELEAGSRQVEVSLSAVGMTAGDTVSFQYRDGGSWSAPSTTADVILAQLPSGTHRYEFRALNADGLPGQQIATLDLVVLTAVWQRGWFILTGSGLILVSAFFVYRARVRYVLGRERAKRLDADNRELERRVAEGIEKLRQAERMAAYGQMVASVAHEVRHPVFSLRTAAYLIAQKEGAGPQDGPLAVIREETDRIARLVDELLAFAREPALVVTEVSPHELLEDVAASYRAVAGNSGPVVQVEAAPQLPDWSLDRDRMRQVLINLLENAHRHGEAKRVTLRAFIEAQRALVLEVIDDGKGIPPELAPRVFEPFFTGGRGTGLGLAIVERLIKAHGGTVQISAVAGGGTCVRLRLPML